jgi:hypothetical protein
MCQLPCCRVVEALYEDVVGKSLREWQRRRRHAFARTRETHSKLKGGLPFFVSKLFFCFRPAEPAR